MYTYAKREDTKNNFGNAKKEPARKRNQTGIPDALKSSMELFSGLSLDDVRVHYSSDKPERLQALAYTQGNQIYLGTGHENSLPHELGHVIQQKQGRVRVTPNPAGLPVNLERELEEEADWIGSMAARGWNHPQSAGIQQGGGSVLAVPAIQMDYGTKFEKTKAEILANLRDRGIIGLSDLGADKFTWHHIYPKTFLLNDQNLKFLAEHADFISLGPEPKFRMDDPGSDDLDYDYLPYEEGESSPRMTSVSEQLRQVKDGTRDLKTMSSSLLSVGRESDDKEKHVRDIDLRWAQWFIPSNSLETVFGKTLAPKLIEYQRNYKVYPTKIDLDSTGKREQGVKEITGLPLMSLNKDLLGEELYTEIQRRYQENGEIMFRNSIRRGSQGPIINDREREIEHKKHLLTPGFILTVIGKMGLKQKIYLKQISYAVSRTLQNIEIYLSQYGIDISSKTAGMTLETIGELDISDQFESFKSKVIELQESKEFSDQIQLRKWFFADRIYGGEKRSVPIGGEALFEKLNSFFQYLQDMKAAFASSSQEKASPKPKTGKHGKKGTKKKKAGPVDIRGMSIAALLDKGDIGLETTVDLDWLKRLFLPDKEADSRNRQMREEFFENESRQPSYELPEEMMEPIDEAEKKLSEAASALKQAYQGITYGGYQGDPTDIIFERFFDLKVDDLDSPSIKSILFYQAGLMEHYRNLWDVSIEEDQIQAYFEEIESVVAGKIEKVIKPDQPVPKDKELIAAAWNIANQVEVILKEPDDKYLARVEEAILQVVAPIVEEPQVEEDMVEIPEADDLTGTP